MCMVMLVRRALNGREQGEAARVMVAPGVGWQLRRMLRGREGNRGGPLDE